MYKMKPYCVKCRKGSEKINPKHSNNSNSETMILSKRAICGSQKSIFIQNTEAKGLLINLGIRSSLRKVTLLGDILLYKLDIDRLALVPVNLSNLSDVVKNNVVKKAVNDKLVPTVNSIDTNAFVLKTNCDTDKAELENKLSDTSVFVKITD